MKVFKLFLIFLLKKYKKKLKEDLERAKWEYDAVILGQYQRERVTKIKREYPEKILNN